MIAGIIAEQRPDVMFFPHDTDWNSTHVGTHLLLLDALRKQPAGLLVPLVVETEFWGAMASPNLMVELSVEDVTRMITALSFHVGEVQRNPYHLLVPAGCRITSVAAGNWLVVRAAPRPISPSPLSTGCGGGLQASSTRCGLAAGL